MIDKTKDPSTGNAYYQDTPKLNLNEVMCVHCPNVIKVYDTICPHCGGEQPDFDEGCHGSSDMLSGDSSSSFWPFISVGAIFWALVAVVGYLNGWFL